MAAVAPAITGQTHPAIAARSGLLQFVYLQGLDVLSTLAFLLAGVQEGNPIVRIAIQLSNSPLGGLIAVKLAAFTLGYVCWRQGRARLLERANLFFACLVAWNLCCLILGLGHRG